MGRLPQHRDGGEAKAVADLTQISYALPEPDGSAIRTPLVEYANEVRQSEWPAMARGFPSVATVHALAHLTEAVLDVRTGDLRDLALYQQCLRLVAVIQDNRNERLDSADGSVPLILWLALTGGAMITLGYPAFFGSSNLIAQTLMTAGLAALVALALIPALLLDYPFTGDVTISSAPFDHALQQMPPHLNGHPPPGIEPLPPQP